MSMLAREAEKQLFISNCKNQMELCDLQKIQISTNYAILTVRPLYNRKNFRFAFDNKFDAPENVCFLCSLC